MPFFFKTENEENVLICLRIIIELHKQFRPPITQEVSVYSDGIYEVYWQIPSAVWIFHSEFPFFFFPPYVSVCFIINSTVDNVSHPGCFPSLYMYVFSQS